MNGEKGILFTQGNEACVRGALYAGLRFFAGYPITPSTEVAELLSEELPHVGGRFIQMEDEISSLCAVCAASVAGDKAMTATSGPGFSLKQENIGYACLAEIPMVIVDVQRCGPSTGMPTSPSQGDVMMARWGTHGDHPIIVISPSSVRETYTLAVRCFNLSEKYRTPVIFLMDEIIGHLREGMELPEPEELEVIDRPTVRYPEPKRLPYHMKPGQLVPQMAPFGCGQRYNITGLIHDETGFPTNSTEEAAKLMDRLMRKISDNYDDIVQCERVSLDDAETVIICYGGTMRAAKSAMEQARANGKKVGIFRPITIWPFPERELREICKTAKRMLVAEHNGGQILLEVERIVKGACAVDFIGRLNGTVITPQEILKKLEEAE